MQNHYCSSESQIQIYDIDSTMETYLYLENIKLRTRTLQLFNSLCTNGFFLMVNTINLGWSIVYFKGLQVIISK